MSFPIKIKLTVHIYNEDKHDIFSDDLTITAQQNKSVTKYMLIIAQHPVECSTVSHPLRLHLCIMPTLRCGVDTA